MATEPAPSTAPASLSIGPISLGEAPRLVAILDEPHPVEFVQTLKQRGASILEIRIDSFASAEEGLDYLRLVAESPGIRENFGLLGTHRENERNRGSRKSVFAEASRWADALDIEYECDERQELVELARAAGCLAILSSHDFVQTPPDQRLKDILNEAKHLGAELAKLAVFANSLSDLRRLLLFTERHQSDGLVTIAMGEHGLLSRLAAPFFGSLLSYGFVSRANAPGQLSLDELHEGLLRFHPAYARDFKAAS